MPKQLDSVVDVFAVDNKARLFKRDYSAHPILGSRAGTALAKPPTIADCRALADIASDFNYYEHCKAEASAAQTFCDLILTGVLAEYHAISLTAFYQSMDRSARPSPKLWNCMESHRESKL